MNSLDQEQNNDANEQAIESGAAQPALKLWSTPDLESTPLKDALTSYGIPGSTDLGIYTN